MKNKNAEKLKSFTNYCKNNPEQRFWQGIREEYQPKIGTSYWVAVPDPMYICVCPNCKTEILMTTPSFLERLKRIFRRVLK